MHEDAFAAMVTSFVKRQQFSSLMGDMQAEEFGMFFDMRCNFFLRAEIIPKVKL